MKKHAFLLAAALVFAGCDRESQAGPFSTDLDGETTRAVTEAGGTVTSSAGAAVRFPAGAVTGTEQITVRPVATPGQMSESGTAASQAFSVEPAGLELARPASVEMTFDRSSLGSEAWLASLVTLTADGRVEAGATRVDLSTGIASAGMRTLGTVAVVVPEPSAIVSIGMEPATSLGRISAAYAATGTDSIVASCGGPGERCGGLEVAASPNLLSLVSRAAVVYPYADGVVRISGATATGSVGLRATLRVLLSSGEIAENVEINAIIRPGASTVVTETAESVTFTNMVYEVSGSAGGAAGSHQEIRSLEISKLDARPMVTVTRRFQISGASGALEDAWVTVSFPIVIHQ